MTDDALTELEALATAATPGRWNYGGWMTNTGFNEGHFVEMDEKWTLAVVDREKDAAFIAAANPATVLALVAEIRRLRALLVRLGEWDMMDATADGPSWRREIAEALHLHA